MAANPTPGTRNCRCATTCRETMDVQPYGGTKARNGSYGHDAGLPGSSFPFCASSACSSAMVCAESTPTSPPQAIDLSTCHLACISFRLLSSLP